MSRYQDLTREDLIARLSAYEKAGPPPVRAGPVAEAEQKPFQFHQHPTRHIAIFVSYQGWPYSGLAIQPTSPYPTVEGELLKALEKCRLIPDGGWEACGFSRCGRTDRGVSGEGQVLNLWVRSNRQPGDGGHDLGDSWKEAVEPKPEKDDAAANDADGEGQDADKANPDKEKEKKQDKKIAKPRPPPQELNYPRLLNGVLPLDIRVLAWSPVPADFDSRFSCQYRHYKYAFHHTATLGRPPLDLDRMTEGAQLLVGEHDFRNFCRLDGSKQIENHSRRVLKAYFEPGEQRGHIIFNLIGTAFLWHQVRHIIAVLFLIGTGVEPPSLVSSLLDVDKYPAKPNYPMGHPLPLTLHECGYAPEAGLDWRYGPYDGPWQALADDEKEKVRPIAEMGRDMLERQLDGLRQEAEIRAWQVGGALRRARDLLGPVPTPTPEAAANPDAGVAAKATKPKAKKSIVPTIYPTGAGEHVITKIYKPTLERQFGDDPETVNCKWREQRKRRDDGRAEEAAKALDKGAE